MPSSTTFDPVCYLQRYPDLRRNWMFKSANGGWLYAASDNHSGKSQWKISEDPLKHWQEVGVNEGRVPGCDLQGTYYSTLFNGGAYLARYWDVRNDATYKSNPLGHYTNYGSAEGRVPGYEIIIPGTTPALTDGVVSPGTVLVQSPTATPEQIAAVTGSALEPGDNTVVLTPAQTTAAAAAAAAAAAPNPNMIYYIAGGGILLIFLLSKNKKHKK